MARYRLIACEIMSREVCHVVAESPAIVHLTFLPKGLHDNPEELLSRLQTAVLECEGNSYDAVLLGFGLCSNGTLGLWSREHALVMPRAHDCIAVFMDSPKAYEEHFAAHPGTYYHSPGWLERGGDTIQRSAAHGRGLGGTYEEYVVKYGEENARYLWEVEQSWASHYTRCAYIDTRVVPREEYVAEARAKADEQGWAFEEIVGGHEWLARLVHGEWREEEFLVVPPGKKIASALAAQPERIVTWEDM